MFPTTKIARSVINKNIQSIGAIHHGVRYDRSSKPNERFLRFYDVSVDDGLLAELLVEECNEELKKLGYEPTVRYTCNPRRTYNENAGMTRNVFSIKARAIKK